MGLPMQRMKGNEVAVRADSINPEKMGRHGRGKIAEEENSRAGAAMQQAEAGRVAVQCQERGRHV